MTKLCRPGDASLICIECLAGQAIQLLNSLNKSPQPRSSHSSPCRPHCITVPELLDRGDVGRDDVVRDRFGFTEEDEFAEEAVCERRSDGVGTGEDAMGVE